MPINTVSDVIGTHGAPPEWTDSQGKKYQLSLINLKAQSKIERMIEHDAIEALKAHKDLIGEEEYALQLSRLLRDITQGRFNFGGEYCQDALETIKGVSAMVSAIFNVDRDEAMRLITTEPEVKDVVGMITERSYPKKAEKPAAE
jgi:hypothetical protein